MKKKSKNYHEELIKSLKDTTEATAYLNAALAEGEPKLFLLALKNVAEAHGGMAKLSKKTQLNRESLYKMLSKKGNPSFDTLNAVLHALGLKISVQTDDSLAA